MRYDTIEQAKQGRQIISFMYKHLSDGELRPHWRDSRVLPLTWRHGKKGTHILGWDIDANNWRRFALINMNEVQLTEEEWMETDEFKKATGA